MENKLKLLYISSFPSKNFPQKGIFNYRSTKLLRKDVDITILTINVWRKGNFLRKEKYKGVLILKLYIPFYPSLNILIYSISIFLINNFVYYFLKNRFDFDIIHSVGATYNGILGSFLSKKFGIPNIAEFIGTDANNDFIKLKNSRIIENFFKDVTYITCDSYGIEKELMKYFKEFKIKERIETIYRGINVSSELKAGIVKNNKLKVLFLGGIPYYKDSEYKDNLKGGRDLMRLWSKSNLLNEKFILYFAGPSSDISEVELWRDKLHNPESVNILGVLTPNNVYEMYNEIDIVLVLSYTEGLPNVALEAGLYKKIIIATDVGGIPEIIKNGKNGYLIHPGDINNLERILAQIYNNFDKNKILGINLNNTIKNKFDNKLYLRKYVLLYNKLLQTKKFK